MVVIPLCRPLRKLHQPLTIISVKIDDTQYWLCHQESDSTDEQVAGTSDSDKPPLKNTSLKKATGRRLRE